MPPAPSKRSSRVTSDAIASRPADPYFLGSTVAGSRDKVCRTAAVNTLFSWVAMLTFVMPARIAATRSRSATPEEPCRTSGTLTARWIVEIRS